MLIVLYLVLFVDNSISGISTTNKVNECMKDGGYCQTSWECCSHLCLSYSYKCVKPPRPPSYVPFAPFAPVDGPAVISVDSVDDLVNRFGSDDNKTPETATSGTSISTSSSATENNSQCVGIGHQCSESSQCCSNECLRYMDINICIEKRATTIAPDGQCLKIGEKCYRHEECCTERCHGFLHQCVT